MTILKKVTPFLKKPGTRLVISLVVIVLFGLLQYRLANVPLAVNLPEITIPPVRSGEQLAIDGLSSNTSTESLLFHRGSLEEEQQFFFEQAIIPENIRSDYSIDQRSATPQRIDCFLFKDPKAPPRHKDPCATAFNAQVEKGDGVPKRIIFFQADEPGEQTYRSLSFKVDVPVLFKMSVIPPPGAPEEDVVDDGPGCVKQLTGANGRWSHKWKGAADDIATRSQADSSIRVRFLPLDVTKQLWSGKDGVFEPFSNLKLEAKTVSITSNNGKVVFEAKAPDSNQLEINRLKVGSDQLQMQILGKAYVTANGEPITHDLVKRIDQNRVLAGLFVALNSALIGWFISTAKGFFFPPKEEKKATLKKTRHKK